MTSSTPYGQHGSPRQGWRDSIGRCLTQCRQAWVRRGTLSAFCLVILAHLFSCGSAGYQRELCKALDSAMHPGGRLLGALPREHGKSSFGTVALILRELCLGGLEDMSSGADRAAPDASGDAITGTDVPDCGTVRWNRWIPGVQVLAPEPAKEGSTRRAAGGNCAAISGPATRAGLRRRPRTGPESPCPGPLNGAARRPRAGVPGVQAPKPIAGRPAKRNILIIGANQQEANAKLRLIVQELERNALVHALCGAAIQPLRDLKGHNVAYGDSEIVLASGARVRAIGFGAKVRGQLFDGRRPDLIVLDDPEDDHSVSSAMSRRRLRSWCDAALLNSLDLTRGSLVWLGTLLRHDSVLAQWIEEKQSLLAGDHTAVTHSEVGGQEPEHSAQAIVLNSNKPGFDREPKTPADPAPGAGTDADLRAPASAAHRSGSSRWAVLRMAALDEKDRPLWPARWSYNALMQRKAEIGARAFAQEYLNQPLSRELIVFRDSDWRIFDAQQLVCDGEIWCACGEPLTVAIGMDPAIGAISGRVEGSHDYCAIAVVGIRQAELDRPPASTSHGADAPEPVLSHPLIYVLDLFREHLTFAAQLSRLERLCSHWRARQAGVEAVAYQQALSQSAISRGLPVLAMAETRGKAVRIEAMGRHVQEGRVLLPASAPWVAELRREAAEYPAGAHDDQLDALARAIEVALTLGSGRRDVGSSEELREASAWRGYL